jgi:anti-anti-sigma factor
MNTELEDDTIFNDVVVLAPRGMVFDRQMLIPFYRRLAQCEKTGHTRVAVDLSGVKGFGAALLGWLVATRQQLQKVGGEVVLVGLSERGIRILKMSKLSKVFRHFATVDQAVTAFDDRHLCTAA